jgi:hypothetical protein
MNLSIIVLHEAQQILNLHALPSYVTSGFVNKTITWALLWTGYHVYWIRFD